MAKKVPGGVNCVDFWESIASTFASNDMVCGPFQSFSLLIFLVSLLGIRNRALRIASLFSSTPHNNAQVFYELYNEPHVQNVSQWMNGDSSTAGMLEMLAAVRAHSKNPVIIAGAKQ